MLAVARALARQPAAAAARRAQPRAGAGHRRAPAAGRAPVRRRQRLRRRCSSSSTSQLALDGRRPRLRALARRVVLHAARPSAAHQPRAADGELLRRARRGGVNRATIHIPCTHVGSLVRPDESSRTAAHRRGPAVDEDASRPACATACTMSCAASATPGSTSSATASSASRPGTTTCTAASRASRSARRPRRASQRGAGPARTTIPTDWARFPDFYAEYFAKERDTRSRAASACTGPVRYTGQAAIARDIVNLTAAMDAAGVEDGFLPVGRALQRRPDRIDEHYGGERGRYMSRSPTR